MQTPGINTQINGPGIGLNASFNNTIPQVHANVNTNMNVNANNNYNSHNQN